MTLSGGGAPETLQTAGGLAMGKCDRGSAMADWPPDDGPGNAPPPVGLRWISTSRADEHAKQRAADCHVLRETNIGQNHVLQDSLMSLLWQLVLYTGCVSEHFI